ncbi:MAG: cytochrome C biogenesis protein [Chitinophagaceae bacterium]|nr:cytochrome C biogenesis protein [Chitinophagaceae bacterium]
MEAFPVLIRLVKKDLLIEWRMQQNLYGMLVYAVCTIFILYLAAGQPEATQWNALFWTTQLFIVVNAVVKSFVGEPAGRYLYYYSVVSPGLFLGSRMILNVVYMVILSSISLLLFRFFLGDPLVKSLTYWGITLLGGTGLSLVFTLLSAIASKARQQASLIAILGFPIIIPQLMLLIRLSKAALGEIFKEGVVWQLAGLLLSLDLLVIIMASVLFPYIWKD